MATVRYTRATQLRTQVIWHTQIVPQIRPSCGGISGSSTTLFFGMLAHRSFLSDPSRRAAWRKDRPLHVRVEVCAQRDGAFDDMANVGRGRWGRGARCGRGALGKGLVSHEGRSSIRRTTIDRRQQRTRPLVVWAARSCKENVGGGWSFLNGGGSWGILRLDGSVVLLCFSVLVDNFLSIYRLMGSIFSRILKYFFLNMKNVREIPTHFMLSWWKKC